MPKSRIGDYLRIIAFAILFVLVVRFTRSMAGGESSWIAAAAGGMVTFGFRLVWPGETGEGQGPRWVRALLAAILVTTVLGLIL